MVPLLLVVEVVEAPAKAASSGAGGLLITSQAEPQFSFVSPSIIYVTRQDSNHDWPIVQQFDFSTGLYTDLLNLILLDTNLPGPAPSQRTKPNVTMILIV